jgi:hypothetical protein
MAEDIRIYVDPAQIRRFKSSRKRISVRAHLDLATLLAAVAISLFLII